MGQRHECPIYGHKSRWQGPILRCSSWEWTEPRQRWAAMMILRERADRYALNLAESPSLLREAAMKALRDSIDLCSKHRESTVDHHWIDYLGKAL